MVLSCLQITLVISPVVLEGREKAREPRSRPHPIHIIEGDAYSLSVGGILRRELPSLAKQQIRKGINCNEKSALNCFDGRRIGFHSRAAF